MTRTLEDLFDEAADILAAADDTPDVDVDEEAYYVALDNVVDWLVDEMRDEVPS